MHAQPVLTERHEQHQRQQAAGALVALCALGAAGCAAVPGRQQLADGSIRLAWNYQAAFWPLVLCLAAAGLIMIMRPRETRPAAVVAAILGAQVAGHGLVAVRDWFNASGAFGMASHNLATVVTFAAGVAVFGTIATCVTSSTPTAWRPARPGYVVGGALLAVALPLTLGVVSSDADITSLGQYALTYSLPWGAGLASGGWREPGAAVAAVAGSAAVVVAV
ncbi:hypothetical protein [Asanoa iriomotensis]|uniref:Copper resistance protein D n=1 Tax=Asanoa iriomotensis TaxID=234613 RepID=A0ABQ4C9V6_9ACTN|nr:hypothetical protein [Asanoa iriomotensis]GIF59556.1 hypothetical protein Air01nite_56510 [Asanoa iriomotensis]